MDSHGAAIRGAATRAGQWWRSWRARFGLAEVCGTTAAATLGEFAGFYGCIGTQAALAAWRGTAHLAGWRRLGAGAWHAVTQQLASCAAAEAVDFVLIRPAILAGAAWLLLSLPGGIWLGFGVGKAVADVFWYGAEATARRGLVRWSGLA
jgi:hypothetical protein